VIAEVERRVARALVAERPKAASARRIAELQRQTTTSPAPSPAVH
jgi:hypothetical protein